VDAGSTAELILGTHLHNDSEAGEGEDDRLGITHYIVFYAGFHRQLEPGGDSNNCKE